MNLVHIFILNEINAAKNAGIRRRPICDIVVTQEGFEPPTL